MPQKKRLSWHLRRKISATYCTPSNSNMWLGGASVAFECSIGIVGLFRILLARMGSRLVGIKLNNSKICYYVQRNLVHELSFDSNLLRTSSLHDMFPKKFNCTSIELQDLVRSKHAVFEAFLRRRRPSKQKFAPSPRDTDLFQKGGKITLVDFFLTSFVISQSRHNRLQKYAKKVLVHRHFKERQRTGVLLAK